MKARIFIEVDLDDHVLFAAFGDKLPEMMASHIFEERLTVGAVQFLQAFNGAKEVKGVYIPELLTGNKIIP